MENQNFLDEVKMLESLNLKYVKFTQNVIERLNRFQCGGTYIFSEPPTENHFNNDEIDSLALTLDKLIAHLIRTQYYDECSDPKLIIDYAGFLMFLKDVFEDFRAPLK